jgi:predicted transcriptional regulator
MTECQEADTGLLTVRDEHEPAYRRVTEAQTELMLELAVHGRTQLEIAEAIGVTQATVSRTLSKFKSTKDLAKKYADAEALPVMEAVVESAKKGNVKAASLALGVAGLMQKEQPALTNIAVVVGGNGQAVGSNPFEG